MDYLVVCIVALVASGLTFFSGFGLGTLLMPAFALFFPLEVAIAATAVVHFANNLFALAMVGRQAHRGTLLRFAPAAVLAAFIGAWVLSRLQGAAAITTYTLADHEFQLTPIKLTIGLVIAGFAVLEFLPGYGSWAISPRWLPLGGALSGFFGGLSGHQGAPRAAFLIRCGLTKEQFIGTGVVCACLIDLARLAVYGTKVQDTAQAVHGSGLWVLVAAASLAAFVGTVVGTRLVKKVTVTSLRILVAITLGLFAIALGAGIL